MTPAELQEKARKFVEREVIYCVSMLIYNLRDVADQLDDYDTYLTLVQGKQNWEEDLRWWLRRDADLSELEDVATYLDGRHLWDEIKDRVGYNRYLEEFEADHENDDPDVEAEPLEFDDWVEDAHTIKKMGQLKPEIADLIIESIELEGCWGDVGQNFDREPDYDEIYEHWIVTGWLGRKLQAHGHVVEEYMSMTIWGRPTTGQSIYMDSVIEEIITELEEERTA